MSGLADTILFLANPGYFMLAKEFNVSVDDVASAFSASYAGNAVFLYAVLHPARLTRTCTADLLLTQIIIGFYASPSVSSMAIRQRIFCQHSW